MFTDQAVQDGLKEIFRMLLTVTIVIVSVWILIWGTDSTLKQAATGFIGTVIGYWLR